MFSMGPTPDASPLDEHLAAHVAELFRAFSDTGRVRLLSTLVGQELNVGGLAGRLGVSESAVSHQLRGLRRMHLVRSRRVGRKVFYRIEDEHVVTLLRQALRHGTEGSAVCLATDRSRSTE